MSGCKYIVCSLLLAFAVSVSAADNVKDLQKKQKKLLKQKNMRKQMKNLKKAASLKRKKTKEMSKSKN